MGMPTNHLLKFTLACMFAVLLLPVPVRSPENASSAPSAAQDSTTAAVPPLPFYPNSTAGLENLIKDMLDLEKRGNRAILAAYFRSLILPHAEAWFTSRFGDENCEDKLTTANDCLGPRLALRYASIARTLPSAVAMTTRDLLDEELTSFEAVNYIEPCASPKRIVPEIKFVNGLTTTPILSPVLSELVRNKEPVYVLWAWGEAKETIVAFFVYSEGGFRYVGMPHPVPLEDFRRTIAAGQGNTEGVQQVGDAVATDDLTEDVLDVKPVLVDQRVAQWTVVLQVVIGKDGDVQQVTYVRGPEELKDAAIRSVKQRHFGPQSLGGHPMQVQTCISVNVPVTIRLD